VQGRIQEWAWGLNPPLSNKNIAPPPNEMKPISTFGLGLMFFARFVSKKGMGLKLRQVFHII